MRFNTLDKIIKMNLGESGKFFFHYIIGVYGWRKLNQPLFLSICTLFRVLGLSDPGSGDEVMKILTTAALG